MSLDGFIADTDDGVDRVFAWYTKPQPPRQSADRDDRDSSGLGVIVYGRRTFEVANGWGGNHPLGVPVIVLTHTVPDGWPRSGSSVLFNTQGIQSAIEQAKTLANGKDVALGSPTIIQQCLDPKLVDRLQVSLIPLLLSNGIKFFENLASAPIELETPTVNEGNSVTHLAYSVLKPAALTRPPHDHPGSRHALHTPHESDVAREARSGRQTPQPSRVRSVRSRRFEFAAYRDNITAGEVIGVARRAALTDADQDWASKDFWIFDETLVVLMSSTNSRTPSSSTDRTEPVSRRRPARKEPYAGSAGHEMRRSTAGRAPLAARTFAWLQMSRQSVAAAG